LKTAVTNAVHFRSAKIFHDGNHHTAILLLFETLANNNILLHANALNIYIIISNRGSPEVEPWEEIEQRLVRYCRRRLTFGVVSAERRKEFAVEVQCLVIWNSVFNQLREMWKPWTANPEREMAKICKKIDRHWFKLFMEFCVEAHWEGAPMGWYNLHQE